MLKFKKDDIVIFEGPGNNYYYIVKVIDCYKESFTGTVLESGIEPKSYHTTVGNTYEMYSPEAFKIYNGSIASSAYIIKQLDQLEEKFK